jgi:hypothetical protein
MQSTYPHPAHSSDRLLEHFWKVLAGLAVAAALVFLGTFVVEATLPQLPDQARAGTAMRPSAAGLGGVVSRAGAPAAVEHFHAQFLLQPGQDPQGHIEGF